MSLVSVQKTAVLTRNECLETKLTTCGTYGLTCKHFALDGHRTHGQFMLNDFIYLTYTYCLEVLTFFNGLNLSHVFCTLNCY